MRTLILCLLLAGCVTPPQYVVTAKPCPDQSGEVLQRDLTQAFQGALYLLPDGSVCQRDYGVD